MGQLAAAAVAHCATNDAGGERTGAGTDDEGDEESEETDAAEQKADDGSDDQCKDKADGEGDDVVPAKSIEVDVLLLADTFVAAVADGGAHGTGDADRFSALVAAQECFPIGVVGAGQAFRFAVAAHLDGSGSAVINGATGGVAEDFEGFFDFGKLLLGVGAVIGGFQRVGLVELLQPYELLGDLFLIGVFAEIEGPIELLVALIGTV